MSNDSKMDSRCPRKLKEFPANFCPLAVLRLKALRNAGKELTEQEEAKLPGCEFALAHQMANYCFFDFMANHYPFKPISDMDIAHYCCVSAETVKKVEKEAILKLRKSSSIQEITDLYETDRVMEDIGCGSEWEFADD